MIEWKRLNIHQIYKNDLHFISNCLNFKKRNIFLFNNELIIIALNPGKEIANSSSAARSRGTNLPAGCFIANGELERVALVYTVNIGENDNPEDLALAARQHSEAAVPNARQLWHSHEFGVRELRGNLANSTLDERKVSAVALAAQS